MAVDPKDRKHISATSWGYGVLDIHNKVIDTLFDQTNSQGALVPFTSGSFTHLRVSGLAYDKQGNLWITNSLVDRGLVVRYHDGSWRNFDISPILQGLANDKKEIDKLVWDSVTDYKWFIGKANRIYVHDGVNKLAYVNPNNGSKLETHTVTCLVQDRSGDLWFGTDKGIKVIYDGYRAFANGGRGEMAPVNCSNILYNEDGINEYLMAYESITCMAVDGANRKWVGTSNNGLYLISANGLEQLHHFTTANSPLASDKIVNSPKVYTSFLLYLLSELYEQLPEVGDLDKPKLVFFFDEAHMLFNGINKSLLEKIEQMVRLIRSKGVGIYFCTQNPDDIPDTVLGQLGNRVQHALRAYTPRDQKAVRVAAQTFRANPAFDTAEMITQMGVGEALVSFLDAKGGQRLISTSMVFGKYDRLNDRVSAYEILSERMEQAMQEKEQALQQKEEEKRLKEEAKQQREEERLQAAEERKRKAEERERQRAKEKSLGGSLQKMVVTKAKRELVNEAFKLGRGLLGSLLKGRK